MQPIAPFSASLAELRKNPKALLKKFQDETVAIFEKNAPAAYLISLNNPRTNQIVHI